MVIYVKNLFCWWVRLVVGFGIFLLEVVEYFLFRKEFVVIGWFSVGLVGC